MSVDPEIEKLRGHIHFFSDEVLALIETFELLLPAAKSESLIAKFNGKPGFGFVVLRNRLIADCILRISRLTYDRGESNSAVKVFAEKLLSPDKDALRQRLREIFATPVRAAPPLRATAEELAELEALQESVEQDEARDLERAFDSQLSELRAHWEWFQSEEDRFKKVRDKHLAHLELTKGETGYQLKEVVGPDWETFVAAKDRLIELAKLLSLLVSGSGFDYDDWIKKAKKRAEDFWSVANCSETPASSAT